MLGFWQTLGSTHSLAVFAAFASAIVIWGWIELAFLTGVVTGPNIHQCPEHLPLWERFIRALGHDSAYNEMLLVAVLVAMLMVGQGAENPFGVWTFAVLYAARVSAKLNLFLGVPRINVEFIPQILGHLTSHFRIARLNWFFPFSVTALTSTVVLWITWAVSADGGHAETGYALLASLTALALLEHWLMVLPLPDAKLWRWMLPASRKSTRNTSVPEVNHAL